MSEKTIRYGWWSDKQERLGGSVAYTTPNGGSVRVTQVTRTNQHGTKWDDIVCLGQVVDYIPNSSVRGEYQLDDDYDYR